MSPSHGDETYVLDACAVIDFCGRTANLPLLLGYVGDSGVVTSEVVSELECQCGKYPLLNDFLALVTAGTVKVVDPDLTNADVMRIVRKWSGQFGLGEVSSAALAITQRLVFVSRDRAPMQQLRLSETIKMQSTADVVKALVRNRTISSRHGDEIMAAAIAPARRRR
jgi:hypothetical protein